MPVKKSVFLAESGGNRCREATDRYLLQKATWSMVIQEIVVFHVLSNTYRKERQGSHAGRSDWMCGKTREKDFAIFVLL